MERSIELGFLGGANDKEPACQCRRRKRPGLILGWEDSLEESTPTRPSILAWRIPWTEEPRGATAHRAAKSQTRPRRLSAHIHRASAASRLSGHPQGQRGFSGLSGHPQGQRGFSAKWASTGPARLLLAKWASTGPARLLG